MKNLNTYLITLYLYATNRKRCNKLIEFIYTILFLYVLYIAGTALYKNKMVQKLMDIILKEY